jgi:hypothetical protein
MPPGLVALRWYRAQCRIDRLKQLPIAFEGYGFNSNASMNFRVNGGRIAVNG